MEQKTNRNDLLQKERSLLNIKILQLERILGYPQGVNRQKNAADSRLYRMKGNVLFKSHLHNQEIHRKILELYSQSIALAPNRSEELAMAYGNRSALLLHLKKYEECLEDCNRAISITESELLRAKLVCRKLECLRTVGDESFENECDETQRFIKEMELSNDMKVELLSKINCTKNSTSEILNSTEDTKDREESRMMRMQPHPSELFDHQTEIPCASEAVTIEYNEEYGRHIIATRNIEPGEVVAVEKLFHKFVFTEDLYVYCNYCIKFSWSSIPCESCIYGVYCSKKCRDAAWEEFHKFECKIFPRVWDIAGDLVSATQRMRFFFVLVHKAGGIENLRQEFMDVQKSTDARSKGFSDDGVFHSDQSKSVLSLDGCAAKDDQELERSMTYHAACSLYYLVKDTDFFGPEKLGDCLMSVVSENDLVEFVGAFLIRIAYMSLLYGTHLMAMTNDDESCIGCCLSPFSGLFNHNCDPNVRFVCSKNNEIVVYAKYPIKKGEQLFRSYSNIDYTEGFSKEERIMDGCLTIHNFTCKCLACENDLDSEDLPGITDVLKETLEPSEVAEFLKRMRSLVVDCIIPIPSTPLKCSDCRPGFLKEALAMLKEIASKANVHCQQYVLLGQYVLVEFWRTYGQWPNVPDTC